MMMALLLYLVIASVTSETPIEISIHRCCSEGEFYSLPTGTCKTEPAIYTWPPPVHSLQDNHTLPLNFNVTEGLAPCDGDRAEFISTHFTLYDDGGLLLPDGARLKSSEFCISPVGVTDDPAFLVRYCAIDPCNSTSCLRKCCPLGMALNASVNRCQPSPLKFQVDFKNESGFSAESEDLVLRDAGSSSCSQGLFPLEPWTYKHDQFFILPDGQLYYPYAPSDQYSNSYCVENFFTETSVVLNALVCFPTDAELPQDDDDAKTVMGVFPYLLFISSIFLVGTIVVYALISEIRNVHGVTIMCHVASLAAMYTGIGFIQLSYPLPDWACIGIAVVVHFAFLSTFTWLNVMSFDIWYTLRDLRPRKSRNGRLTKRFIYYSLYAWGVPLIIVLTGQILEEQKTPDSTFITPGFGLSKCWFTHDEAFYPYLYGPVAVLIISNIAFFVMTASLLYRASVDAAFAANRAHAKQKLRVIFSLFILMGVSWMMEVISFAVGGTAYIWLLPDIFNILTGVFIFVIFVCKPNVWKLLRMKFSMLERFNDWFHRSVKRAGAAQKTVQVKDESLPTNKHTESAIISEDESKRRSIFSTNLTTEVPSQTDLGVELLSYNSKTVEGQ